MVKNDGSYTYLTPDIAYHKNKYNRGFDQLINIWGADHHGYIPRVKAAMEALGYPSERLTVLVTQMVSLYQGGEKVKMSKRTGKAVTMEDLMDEVGVDAIRYFFTMRGIDSHLDFDMDLAVSQSNENPVYYVQYAHARICSIYRQAEEQGIQLLPLERIELERLQTEAEFELLKKLGELPQEVKEAARTLCTASLNPLYLRAGLDVPQLLQSRADHHRGSGSDSSAPRLGLLCTHRPAQCPAPGRRIRPGTHVILV